MHYMLKERDYLRLISCSTQLFSCGFNILICRDKHKSNFKLKQNIPALQINPPTPKTHFLLFAQSIQLSCWKHHSCFTDPKPSVAVETPLRRNLGVQAALCSAVTLKSSHPDPSASRFTAPVLPDFPAQMGVTMPCTATPPNLLALSVAFHLPTHCYSSMSRGAACSTRMKQVNSR